MLALIDALSGEPGARTKPRVSALRHLAEPLYLVALSKSLGGITAFEETVVPITTISLRKVANALIATGIRALAAAIPGSEFVT